MRNTPTTAEQAQENLQATKALLGLQQRGYLHAAERRSFGWIAVIKRGEPPVVMHSPRASCSSWPTTGCPRTWNPSAASRAPPGGVAAPPGPRTFNEEPRNAPEQQPQRPPERRKPVRTGHRRRHRCPVRGGAIGLDGVWWLIQHLIPALVVVGTLGVVLKMLDRRRS
ncbi:hypothetical protein SHKM778_94550 (plasmid) [Streptomyces sp. KM77-8]|uniref:Uncharacterized protein n=1 Tax=Streptomyces haneummycinicus TaxID=3074435 RepID=A0AAT9I0N3_9ACTN